MLTRFRKTRTNEELFPAIDMWAPSRKRSQHAHPTISPISPTGVAEATASEAVSATEIAVPTALEKAPLIPEVREALENSQTTTTSELSSNELENEDELNVLRMVDQVYTEILQSREYIQKYANSTQSGEVILDALESSVLKAKSAVSEFLMTKELAQKAQTLQMSKSDSNLEGLEEETVTSTTPEGFMHSQQQQQDSETQTLSISSQDTEEDGDVAPTEKGKDGCEAEGCEEVYNANSNGSSVGTSYSESDATAIPVSSSPIIQQSSNEDNDEDDDSILQKQRRQEVQEKANMVLAAAGIKLRTPSSTRQQQQQQPVFPAPSMIHSRPKPQFAVPKVPTKPVWIPKPKHEIKTYFHHNPAWEAYGIQPFMLKIGVEDTDQEKFAILLFPRQLHTLGKLRLEFLKFSLKFHPDAITEQAKVVKANIPAPVRSHIWNIYNSAYRTRIRTMQGGSTLGVIQLNDG